MKKLALILLIIPILIFSNNLKNSQYKIDKNGYYDVEVASSLRAEYSYSSLLKNSVHLGFSIEAYKFFKPGFREINLASFSVLGDFYNKSALIKLSILSIRFYFNTNTYFQFGFLGVGDDMEIIIFPESGKALTRSKLSLKLGQNIDLSFPKVKLKIYAKIGTETEAKASSNEDKFYKVDGLYFGIGVSLEYNKVRSKL